MTATLPRARHWYSRFGIESPFPWVAVGLVVVLAVAVEGAVLAAVNQFFDVDTGW